jgi:phosphoglycolate phosphatase
MAEPAGQAPPPFDAANVRGLIFDLDGTLVDSYDAIAASLNHARESFGLSWLPPPLIRRTVGRGLERLVADLLGEERVEEGVHEFREHYARTFREATRPLPGALAALRELHRRGYRMTVASNKPARFGEPILADAGMLPYLLGVQGPDRAGATKPDPVMLRACLREMSLPEAQALYVGDMVLDVETAARAGLPVVLVEGGSSTPEALKQTGQRVVSGLGALADLLP